MVASVPAELDTNPSTEPSVHGEYRLPSAAHDGYQVSALVYSAWRAVNSMPGSSRERSNGHLAGVCSGHFQVPAAGLADRSAAAVRVGMREQDNCFMFIG